MMLFAVFTLISIFVKILQILALPKLAFFPKNLFFFRQKMNKSMGISQPIFGEDKDRPNSYVI